MKSLLVLSVSVVLRVMSLLVLSVSAFCCGKPLLEPFGLER
ncbi:hypothetical protein PF008_g22619 [Phytophthora fragariae]|uniref:Uncharacterized protein n=1 Tax=Phytophthora fragariae TaxID=53985 RepID=A0A6G0QTD5_9STRA|nr:hypothetical protein PF008_g22619 [Phytophthora fragariae]